MSKARDGGPAFPRPSFTPATSVLEPMERMGLTHDAQQGMSLRDWYAGMAMQGFLSLSTPGSLAYEEAAEAAYRVADLMLAQREKE